MGTRVGVQECTPVNPGLARAILAQGGLAQPKLNGIHVRLEGGRMYSSEGRLMTSCPHIVAELAEAGVSVSLEGEVYCHGWDLDQIRSVTSRTKNLHPDHQRVSLHVFDLIDHALPQAARLGRLAGLLPSGLAHARLVPTTPVDAQHQLDALLAGYLADGYEGYVLRAARGPWRAGKHAGVLKCKPGGHDTYRVVQACAGHGKFAGTLGALAMEDRDGQQFHVGVLAVDDFERARLWRLRGDLPGLFARVSYKDRSARGVPSQGATYECLVDAPAWATERRAA